MRAKTYQVKRGGVWVREEYSVMGVDVAKEGGDYTVTRIPLTVQMMTDRIKGTGAAIDMALAQLRQAKGEPPKEAVNKGWCLGCRQRGGECQCAELGTDPEWVSEEEYKRYVEHDTPNDKSHPKQA